MATYQLPQVSTGAPAAPAGSGPSLMAVGVTPQLAEAPSADPVHISALPLRVDVDIYKGDDFYLDLTVTTPDGSDADLSGATPSAQIRSAPNSTDIMASFQATIEGNVIHLHLPHGQAVNLGGTSAWDVQISSARGTRETWTGLWNWSSALTGAPGAGEIGLTQMGWDAEDLFVNLVDADGENVDYRLSQLVVGDQIRVELATDRNRFAVYTVSGDSLVVSGFREIPVAVDTSGGAVPEATEATKLTIPTPGSSYDITTLAAGSVTVSGEVTMP